MQRPTKEAHEHLQAMVRLANLLITESINQTDPILKPERSISTQDFLREYTEHSKALSQIMSTIGQPEDLDVPEDIDEQIEQSRKELADAVQRLQVKLNKLNHLRFWMDNMVMEKTPDH
ncbi:hypothetical protein TVAG_436490 [Trichomonas vaginalis G3]|uniref:Uncharacterized protein n=1 Tax=Trichomonas vaginalis (strain ATCC PRA-98 / G3) TaxID=412133 RepID=A2DF97_TRIV3|nr:hypothetical protein TVAGG3_0565800 [Trichomonas vaginalis G3]EAY20825.1 hypothetical protein TVAG_436490 [Trichomonas vaginalis G3]KAI5521567.1 hypothetical protein TVAGG3_0565800 [Trichomonas vaginalis G3]|eukprot:XP_001581811.1 hypothetical protein [Trichomonas vaginalis G3]